MPKPSAGKSTLPPLTSLTRLIVASAAGDGAELALGIERLEHHAGVIRQPANDVVIHFHKVAQPARGEIVQNALQFRRRLAGFDESALRRPKKNQARPVSFRSLPAACAPVCQSSGKIHIRGWHHFRLPPSAVRLREFVPGVAAAQADDKILFRQPERAQRVNEQCNQFRIRRRIRLRR